MRHRKLLAWKAVLVLAAVGIALAAAGPAFAQNPSPGGADYGPFGGLYDFIKQLFTNIWWFLVGVLIVVAAVGMLIQTAAMGGGAVIGGRTLVQQAIVAIVLLFLAVASGFLLIPALINWLQRIRPAPPF